MRRSYVGSQTFMRFRVLGYSLLHVLLKSGLTTLFFRTPWAVSMGF